MSNLYSSMQRSLQMAVERNNAAATERILSGSATTILNDPLRGGHYPLTLAIRRGSWAVLEVLLEQDELNVNVRDALMDYPLLLAVKNASSGARAYIPKIIKHGADLNVTDSKGKNAMQICLRFLDFESFQVLNAYGVHADLRGRVGAEWLYGATERRDASCIEVVIKAGANPDSLMNGIPMVIHALLTGSIDCAATIIRCGASAGAGVELEHVHQEQSSFMQISPKSSVNVSKKSLSDMLPKSVHDGDRAENQENGMTTELSIWNIQKKLTALQLALGLGNDQLLCHLIDGMSKAELESSFVIPSAGPCVIPSSSVSAMVSFGSHISRWTAVTPVTACIRRGMHQALARLIDKGVDLNGTPEKDVIEAVCEANTRRQKIDMDGISMLDADYIFNMGGTQETDARTPLMWAVTVCQDVEVSKASDDDHEDSDVQKQILQQILVCDSVRIDETNASGGSESAVSICCYLGHRDALNALFSAKASADCGFAVKQGSLRGQADCLELLFENATPESSKWKDILGPSLLIAAKYGHTGCLKAIVEFAKRIDSSVNLNDATYESSSQAWHESVRFLCHDAPKILESVWTHGSHPDFDTRAQGRALLAAVKTGCYKSSRALLEAGVSPNWSFENVSPSSESTSMVSNVRTPMTVAWRRWGRTGLENYLATAIALTKFGGNVNARDRKGDFALKWACVQGDAAVVHMLLESGADPLLSDKDGNTPAAIATLYGSPSCISALVEANPKCAIETVQLPKHIKTWRPGQPVPKQYETWKKYAFDQMCSQDSSSDASPEGTSVEPFNPSTWNREAILLSSDVAASAPKYPCPFNPCCGPLLTTCIASGWRKTVLRILNAGDKLEAVHEPTPDGDTPLMVAAGMGWVDVCVELLKHGAEVDGASRGCSALSPIVFAAHKGRSAVVSALLEHGSQQYSLALLIASARGSSETVKAILAFLGSNSEITCGKGLAMSESAAMVLCCAFGQKEAAEKLLSRVGTWQLSCNPVAEIIEWSGSTLLKWLLPGAVHAQLSIGSGAAGSEIAKTFLGLKKGKKEKKESEGNENSEQAKMNSTAEEAGDQEKQPGPVESPAQSPDQQTTSDQRRRRGALNREGTMAHGALRSESLLMFDFADGGSFFRLVDSRLSCCLDDDAMQSQEARRSECKQKWIGTTSVIRDYSQSWNEVALSQIPQFHSSAIDLPALADDQWACLVVNTSPLHAATVSGNEQLVQAICKDASSEFVNRLDGIGRSPLIIASHFNHIQIVRSLIAHAADPNIHIDDVKRVVSWFAAREPWRKLLAKCRGKGLVPMSAPDFRFKTECPVPDIQDGLLRIPPILWSAIAGHGDCVKVLLEAGAEKEACISWLAGAAGSAYTSDGSMQRGLKFLKLQEDYEDIGVIAPPPQPGDDEEGIPPVPETQPWSEYNVRSVKPSEPVKYVIATLGWTDRTLARVQFVPWVSDLSPIASAAASGQPIQQSGSSFQLQAFILNSDEYIHKVHLAVSTYCILGARFVTNQRVLPWFGSSKSKLGIKTLSAAPGREFCGIYGLRSTNNLIHAGFVSRLRNADVGLRKHRKDCENPSYWLDKGSLADRVMASNEQRSPSKGRVRSQIHITSPSKKRKSTAEKPQEFNSHQNPKSKTESHHTRQSSPFVEDYDYEMEFEELALEDSFDSSVSEDEGDGATLQTSAMQSHAMWDTPLAHGGSSVRFTPSRKAKRQVDVPPTPGGGAPLHPSTETARARSRNALSLATQSHKGLDDRKDRKLDQGSRWSKSFKLQTINTDSPSHNTMEKLALTLMRRHGVNRFLQEAGGPRFTNKSPFKGSLVNIQNSDSKRPNTAPQSQHFSNGDSFKTPTKGNNGAMSHSASGSRRPKSSSYASPSPLKSRSATKLPPAQSQSTGLRKSNRGKLPSNQQQSQAASQSRPISAESTSSGLSMQSVDLEDTDHDTGLEMSISQLQSSQANRSRSSSRRGGSASPSQRNPTKDRLLSSPLWKPVVPARLQHLEHLAR